MEKFLNFSWGDMIMTVHNFAPAPPLPPTQTLRKGLFIYC